MATTDRERSTPPDTGTPTHLWVVGALALLWEAMGAFDYLATQVEWAFYTGQFTDEQLACFYGFPA